ncbi:tetratricopeptide repeat protein [Francisella philomiragia]|uniref:tetratricopeptide repeat protein n=1 Tax=Francisella philomiragia TaxID=28110 RepID=UPI001903FCE3|nr:tetratricopeptide repeat protein [Francisella philomiragia]MBK2295738.1 hypothetical protein [Francisella philomiragia]MBK2340379.1 hypothetical protein [Francisella philomiragia]
MQVKDVKDLAKKTKNTVVNKHLLSSSILFNEKKYEDCIKEIDNAFKKYHDEIDGVKINDKSYIDLIRRKIYCYLELGDIPNANFVYEDAKQFYEQDLAYEKGLILYHEKNYPEAIQILLTLDLEPNRTNTKAVYLLGVCYKENGEYTESIKYLNRLLPDKDGDRVSIALNNDLLKKSYTCRAQARIVPILASSEIREDELSSAISDLNNAIRIDAMFSKAYYWRAQANKLLKNFNEAFNDIKSVKETSNEQELIDSANNLNFEINKIVNENTQRKSDELKQQQDVSKYFKNLRRKHEMIKWFFFYILFLIPIFIMYYLFKNNNTIETWTYIHYLSITPLIFLEILLYRTYLRHDNLAEHYEHREIVANSLTKISDNYFGSYHEKDIECKETKKEFRNFGLKVYEELYKPIKKEKSNDKELVKVVRDLVNKIDPK